MVQDLSSTIFDGYKWIEISPICGHTKLGYPRGRILEPLKEAVLRNLAHRPGLSPNQSHFWCLILGKFSVQKYHNQKQSILEEYIYIYIYQYNSRIWRYFCTQTDSCLWPRLNLELPFETKPFDSHFRIVWLKITGNSQSIELSVGRKHDVSRPWTSCGRHPRHSYVRRNAVMCVFSIVKSFGVEVLPEVGLEDWTPSGNSELFQPSGCRSMSNDWHVVVSFNSMVASSRVVDENPQPSAASPCSLSGTWGYWAAAVGWGRSLNEALGAELGCSNCDPWSYPSDSVRDMR